MSDLNVRLMRDDDLPAVLQLLQQTFGTWPTVPTGAAAIDHLRWKLGDGRPGEQYHFVVELDGRIVAFQLNMMWRAKVGRRDLRLLRGWDSAVRPDLQGKGVMSVMRPQMNDFFSRNSDFFLGGSDHPATPRLHKRLEEDRRDFGHEWLVYVRPLTLRAAVRAFKIRPDRSPRKLVEGLARLARWRSIDTRERRLEPRLTVRTVERFDQRIDALIEEASSRFDFMIVREQALLNWRYADKRGGDFIIRVIEEDMRVVGYCVSRDAKGTGHIADMLTLPDRPDAVAALARDAAIQLRRAGVPAVECWMFENHPYVATLQSCGYLGRRRRRQLTYEAVMARQSELDLLSSTSMIGHLTIGDIDIV